MAGNILTKKCFPNATRVIDRFHVQKTSFRSSARNKNQIPLASYRSGNEAIEKPRKTKKFEPYVLTNGYF
jgi:hypothetical protein